MDWDEAFAALKAWPYSCTEAQLARQTPRQTYSLWKRLKSLADASGSSPASVADDEPFVADDPSQPERKGVQNIGGSLVNMQNVKEWEGIEGEDDRDPFSVPREIVRERFYAMAYRQTENGTMVQHGVPKGNMTACRNLCDRVWQENTALFDRMTQAFLVPEAEGRAEIMKMAQETGYPYKFVVLDDKKKPLPGSCLPGTESEWYDFVQSRNQSLFEQMRRDHAVREQAE